MLTFGYDELEKKKKLPKKITCKLCGGKHNIECGGESKYPVFSRLQYYKCKGKLYLAGLCWKDIRT